jgi:uncharacterized protein YpuA (DUF1002 family)
MHACTNEPILTYGHSWSQCQNVRLKKETDTGGSHADTAMRGQYTTQHVVLRQVKMQSATGVFLKEPVRPDGYNVS